PCLNDLFRCHHKMGPFGQLLTMVAAALVPFHVSFRLPEADRKALVGTGVYEKKQTLEALLLLKFRQKHLAHDSNGLVQLTRLCMTAHDPCMPGQFAASAQSHHKNCTKRAVLFHLTALDMKSRKVHMPVIIFLGKSTENKNLPSIQPMRNNPTGLSSPPSRCRGRGP